MAIDYKPDLNFRALRFLESIIEPGWKVFEWGSGQSTIFFAKRVAVMASVEHDPVWARIVLRLLSEDDLEIAYRWLPPARGSGLDQGDWVEYVMAIEAYNDNFFDLVFIDGGARLACLRQAIPKVKPGGYILLDDSERRWYWKTLEAVLSPWEKRVFMDRKGCARMLSKATFWRKPCSC